MFLFLMSKERREEYRKKTYQYRKEFIYRTPTPHDWLFPYTGTESDFVSLFARLTLAPMFVFLCICFVHLMSSEYEARTILMLCFVGMDIFILAGYVWAVIKKKKYMEQKIQNSDGTIKKEDSVLHLDLNEDEI